MDVDVDQTIAALAHPVRRTILDQLVASDAPVKALAEPFDISLAAVSQHLKVLEDAGLLTRRIEGRHHYCSLSKVGMTPLLAWADRHREFWQLQLEDLATFAESNQKAADD